MVRIGVCVSLSEERAWRPSCVQSPGGQLEDKVYRETQISNSDISVSVREGPARACVCGHMHHVARTEDNLSMVRTITTL